jgi:hypothetical protein
MVEPRFGVLVGVSFGKRHIFIVWHMIRALIASRILSN